MRIILFLFLGICLTLSIIFSLLLFGLDQTLYSWRFFSHRLNELGLVLSEDSVHRELVKEMIDPLTKSLGNNVPSSVKYMIEEAALSSFTHNWLVDTGGDLVKAVQSVLKRKNSTLDLSVSLQTFKNNFSILLHRSGKFNPREIEIGLREIPDQLILSELLPAELYDRILRNIRTYPVYSNALMYALPLLLCVLCLLLGGMKSGIITMGVPFLVAPFAVQAGRIYLAGNETRVARLFLSQESVQTFLVPLKAGMAGFSAYLEPALIMTCLTAFLILGGGLFLERALKRGDLLTFFAKLKNRKKNLKTTHPWS